MAGSNGVELNLAVGKINHLLTNFIPPTIKTCIKNSRHLHLLCFLIEHVPSQVLRSTKVSTDLAYKDFIAK